MNFQLPWNVYFSKNCINEKRLFQPKNVVVPIFCLSNTFRKRFVCVKCDKLGLKGHDPLHSSNFIRKLAMARNMKWIWFWWDVLSLSIYYVKLEIFECFVLGPNSQNAQPKLIFPLWTAYCFQIDILKVPFVNLVEIFKWQFQSRWVDLLKSFKNISPN